MGRMGLPLSVAVLGGGLFFAAGTPSASAQATGSCSQIEATLTSIQQTLPQAATSGTLATKIKAAVAELDREAASAPSNVRSAVAAFTSQLEAAGAGHVDVAALTAKANAIGTACSSAPSALAPTGAAATGAGGTAGFEDAGLLAAGSAAIAVGGMALFFELRRRHRATA
jgi:hypothetical protein